METAPPPPPSTAPTNAPPPPPKQGFRFYKSGSASSLQRVPSHPSLISESSTTSVVENHPNSLSSAAGAGGAPLGVDSKLYQVVKRITSSTPSLLISASAGNKASQQARKNNIQAVTSLVLEKHREYRRKDLNWVKNGVEGALLALGSSSSGSNKHNNNKSGSSGGGAENNKKRRASSSIVPLGGGSNNSNNHSKAGDSSSESRPNSPAKKKRSLEAGDSSENSPIRREETIIIQSGNNIAPPLTLARSNSGGMLNASLRNRYKDVQREREKEQQLNTVGTGSASVDGNQSDNASTALEESGQVKDESVASPSQNGLEGDGNSASAATPNGSSNNTTTKAASNSTTPKRKKKNKKTPSKSSSSSASNFRTQEQEDNPYSSSSAMLLQPSPRPIERYSNLGGISSLLTQLRELIEYPLSHPELFLHLGVEPPRGVLLRGPPGCGKTHLAKAIAGELNVSYFQVSAPELVGGVSGESEARVRTLFESASNYAPAIIFIDEIDAIAPKRGEGSGGGGGKSMEKRIVAQLLTSMDSIHPKNTRNQSAVMVLGATNRPDAMDPALRRAGRFDREIVLGAPDEKAREGILRVMTKEMRVDDSLDYKVLAKKTPGFVGADVRSLTKEAAVIAINRIFQSELLRGSGSDGNDVEITEEGTKDGTVMETIKEEAGAKGQEADASTPDANTGSPIPKGEEATATNDVQSITPLSAEQLQPLYVTMDDFLSAVPHVQPSSKREGFATVPDVSWSDIGALANIREELTLSVLEPISHPERFEALGLPLPAGVLLYGPPGCGKTLLAKAIANESGANFISVKGPELLDKYVGESERSVRVVFERARSSSPCIIFFDELDSLCPKRGSDGGSGGGGVSERVVNQLLTEMDGLDSRRSVFVIAATNRPELIDPAMLRPGRLDKLLYVPLPSPDDRHSILCALSKKVKLGPDVNLHTIAHSPHANGFSGADCAALLREAGLAVLRDGVLSRTSTSANEGANKEDKNEEKEASLQITAHHFQYAFEHVLPSVSKKDQARYDRLRDRMARARTRGGAGSTVAGRGDASDVEGPAIPLTPLADANKE
mmetsp:Transcript_30424/g.51868  ORF Transcript_30424/g.51868 Transcript_30424/m.51868 type:complete len:1068 (-) Transcript_30424:96-3299(-)